MKMILNSILLCLLSSVSLALPKNISHGSKPIPTSTAKEIIFIHGMFMTPESWQPWLEFFAREYQVSAPAWPYHDQPASVLKTNPHPQLGQLTLGMILDHYRALLLPKKNNPPILIGHSMGGLIAQVLLSEGLGSAAIAIDSAPPQKVWFLNGSFLKANWPVLNLFANPNRPIHLSQEDFNYAFASSQTASAQNSAYDNFYVPESRRVGRGPLTKAASIRRTNARGPLLIIAGEADHIVPAKLNFANFEFYRLETSNQNYTEFQLFEGRDHWIIGGSGWEQVAEAVRTWLQN
ncbi:MAG: alpha/beta hydrolase [Pseudobdellovibrionaceae bacterium]